MKEKLKSLKLLSLLSNTSINKLKLYNNNINNNNFNYKLPKEIKKSHYIHVYSDFYQNNSSSSSSSSSDNNFNIINISKDCLKLIGFNYNEIDENEFKDIFTGRILLEGLDKPYSTLYGCHSYGIWFGQLGDGRAMSLGEIISPLDGKRYEIQLKGSGKTTFSRGFDGKAVIRSCTREFLASEAMYHLQVPTTRGLCVIGTGEYVSRPWYPDTAIDRQSSENIDSSSDFYSYPPQHLVLEPGAVFTRVSPSFFRLSHLEIFSKRNEYSELKQITDYVIWREFPHLSNVSDLPTRYLTLLRESMILNIKLVCNWYRVGYVQGNMNSDNMMIAGRTLDYGPFGWMEKFDPNYQPFTTDRNKHFSFMNQFNALKVNMKTFSESILYLILELKNDSNDEVHENINLKNIDYSQIIEDMITTEFDQILENEFDEMRRKKLGLVKRDESVRKLWLELERLMFESKVDYTIFFRLLSEVIIGKIQLNELLSISMYENNLDKFETLQKEWEVWFNDYLLKFQDENEESKKNIVKLMNETNPKYILRNWMSTLAYESAENGDYKLINELVELLTLPYSEGTQIQEDKWFQKTPNWAKKMPGVAFLSCSS